MTFRLQYLLILIITISSCSEEESESQNEFLQLHEITVNGKFLNRFTYDEENRISSNEIYLRVQNYTYRNDTTFEVTNYLDGSIQNSSIIYNLEPNIVKEEHFDSLGNLEYYYTYKYNVSPCGYSEKSTYLSSGELASSSSIEYIDSNCSSIETFRNSSNEIYKTVTHEKNESFSASNSTRNQPLMFDKQHLWISRSEEDANGVINLNTSFEQTSTLNEFDYPIKTINTTSNNLVREYEYTYY